jgi:hypothetical protein
LGAGLVLSCGKDDDDDDPVAAATYDLKVVDGAVEQFVAAEGATVAPAYGLAVTAAEIAADAAADSDVSYAIGAATDKIALTEWHTVAVTQGPSNCASDSAITAAWADGAWSFTVKKDKVQGRSDACELTVTANMGEAVDSGWVEKLLTEGVENGFKTDDGTTAAKTSACSGCHRFETNNGKFDMKDSDGFSFPTLLNNEESDDEDGAHNQIAAVFKAGLHEVGADCSAVTADGADETSDMTRIAPGDPYGSFLVGLTDVRYDATAADIKGTAYAVFGRDGKKMMRCSSDKTAAKWMPSDKDMPVDGNDNTAWTADIHDKFARWVLQGAKYE